MGELFYEAMIKCSAKVHNNEQINLEDLMHLAIAHDEEMHNLQMREHKISSDLADHIIRRT